MAVDTKELEKLIEQLGETDITFVVHRDWLNCILNLPVEMQDKVIAEFIRYGVGLEVQHTDDTVVQAMVNLLKDKIDYSKYKYYTKVAGGVNSGRKKKVDNMEIWKLAKEGKKSDEIANILNCSKSAVDHSEGWKNRHNAEYFEF